MSGELVTDEWTAVLQQLEDVDALMAGQLQDTEAPALFSALHAAASSHGRMGARAGSTLRTHALADGAAISAGGGTSLGAVLFGGTEYGGQRKRLTYSRRSPRGRGHVVRQRRTTMMFGPPLGAGYWFWPTVTRTTRGIVERTREALQRRLAP